ncbi:MAG: cyclase family protein [Deltaproteobacteria bacterium]|nr:cyclase family protein [Deltaproteobacteria bacterium]
MPGREAMPKLSNWGRWGKDDEKGTANFITADVIVAAAKLVRKGKVMCCCIPIDQFGPVFPTRTSAQRFMSVLNVPIKEIGMPGSAIVNDDYITMYLQGSTQWDSLAHVGYGDRFYNDLPTSAVTAHGGAAKNDIGKLYQSFVTRGVLLDMVRYKGYDNDGHLPKDYPITVADLDGCAQAQKVEVRSGDALCVRTGWVPYWYTLKTHDEKEAYFHAQPGMSVHTLDWIATKQISCIAMDNIAVERLPTEIDGEFIPFHQVAIRDLGLSLGEIFTFEELAKDCAADGVYEFLWVAPPLNIPHAVGSPLNPLAIK